MPASLDEYRAVMAALDRIEASPIAAGPLPSGGGELRFWAQETRALVERMRDRAEDRLFEDHVRLGFESEREKNAADEAKRETSPATAERKQKTAASPEAIAKSRRNHAERRAADRAAFREAVLASNEPTKALAERLKISAVKVAMLRREAGERCAFVSGSGLTAQQRDEIADSAELTKALAARFSVAESLVTKIRKSGRQGGICAPATGQR